MVDPKNDQIYQLLKLVVKGLVLIAIIAVIIIIPIVLYQKQFHFDQQIEVWETETSYEFVPENEEFDLVLLGPSRVREFTRYKGHWSKIQEILGTSRILNMSCGGGAGVLHEKMRLQYFLNKGNRAKRVWYIIDPRVINSRGPNEDNPFGELIFDVGTFKEMIRYGFQYSVIQKYYLNVLNPPKNYTRLQHPDLKTGSLEKVDPLIVDQFNEYYYADGIDPKSLRRYTQVLKDIIALSKKNGMQLTFIIYPEIHNPPEMGMPYLREVLASLQKEYGIGYADLRDVIKDPKYFAEYNYLNSEGLLLWVREYLKPLYDAS